MARRIARDAVVELTYGGLDDGSTPTWGTDVAIQGYAREVTVRQTGQTVDLAGIGDAYARKRFGGNAEQTITISGFLLGNGFQFYATAGSPIGYRARVKIKPNSTLTNPYVFEGIITRWEWSAQAGDRQVETIEIEGPLDV